MSVSKRELKNGILYRYQFTVRGKRISSRTIYETRAQAERAEAAHREKLMAQSPGGLSYLIEKRVESFQTYRRSPDYIKESERYFAKMLEAWGDVPVDSITKPQVHRLVMAEADRLSDKEKTFHKVNAMIRVMKAFFNYCIDIHDIQMKNPVKGIKLFPVSRNSKYIPSATDIQNMEKALNPEQLKLFRFVLETGCRITEALELTVLDVEKEYVIFRSRKSHHSDEVTRKVPRPDCLKDEDLPKTGYVFTAWTSIPRFLSDVQAKMYNANKSDESDDFDDAQPDRYPKKRNGLYIYRPNRWNWHNLRHRAATIWASQNMPIIEIMYRLGHNNLVTTLGYLQLLGFTKFDLSAPSMANYRKKNPVPNSSSSKKAMIK